MTLSAPIPGNSDMVRSMHKIIMRQTVVLLVALAAVAGCDERREREMRDGRFGQMGDSSAAQTGRFSGHLVWGHESRSFKGCDGEREGWVINESGDELVRVYEELTSVPYQEIFVEVRGEWGESPENGFGAEYPETLRITELMRAEGEGFGCNLDLNGVLFVANGNEPFWRLHIRANGLSMWSMDSPGETGFSAPELSESEGHISFKANGAESSIHVVLVKQRCVDTMSGARYQFEATVELEDERFSGCAIEGL